MRQARVIQSSRELSAKERIKILQNGTQATKLDAATMKGEIEFQPDLWAVVHVEPDDSEPFDQYIIEAIDGTMYATGSLAFWTSFKMVWDEMSGEDEDFIIRVFRVPSKKYEGKTFITCTIG